MATEATENQAADQVVDATESTAAPAATERTAAPEATAVQEKPAATKVKTGKLSAQELIRAFEAE